MGDTNTYQSQASELSQQLWGIANELRGNMDASEFKNYILGVIFYRYLSERTEMYMNELLEKKFSRRILVTSVVMQRAYARLHQTRTGFPTPAYTSNYLQTDGKVSLTAVSRPSMS